eukprot:21532-Heterococcus_DN1.PRE.1
MLPLAVLLLCAVVQLISSTEAFVQTAQAAVASQSQTRVSCTSVAAARKDSDSSSAAADAFGKATWAGAEALGNVAAAIRKKDSAVALMSAQQYGSTPTTRAEAIERLQAEYDNAYFISGQLDEALYAEDCEFADPFASFRGRARFKANLENLAGGFIAENDVNLLQPLALETA